MSILNLLTLDPKTLQTYGYTLIFILNIIEGPIVTYIAAFLASQGIFNVFYIFIISLLGNFISDIGAFLLGRFGKNTFLYKYISKPKHHLLKGLKKHLEKNTFISISLIKLINPLAGIGLVYAGTSNISFKKFLPIALIVGIPFALFFTLAGYYSGLAYSSFSHYLKLGQEAIIIILLIFILVWFLYSRFSNYLEKKLKNKINIFLYLF